MKKLRESDKYTLQMVLTFALIAALCVGAFVFLGMQTSQLHSGLNESMANEQLSAARSVALLVSQAENEAEAEKLIAGMYNDGSHYWFLISQTNVVFERNLSHEDTIGKTKLNDLIRKYRRSGASESAVNEYIEKIFGGVDFSVLLTKDKAYGRELISVSFCEIDGQKYAVGCSVKESFLLSASKLNKSILCLRVLTAVLCGLFVIISGTAVIKNFRLRGSVRNAGEELKEKNILIQEQSNRLLEVENNSAKINELYDGRIVHLMLEKIMLRGIKSTGIIVVKLADYALGIIAGENDNMDILRGAVKACSAENDVCASLGSDALILIRVNADIDGLRNTIEKLRALTDERAVHCGIGVSIAENDVYSAAAEAINMAQEQL